MTHMRHLTIGNETATIKLLKGNDYIFMLYQV